MCVCVCLWASHVVFKHQKFDKYDQSVPFCALCLDEKLHSKALYNTPLLCLPHRVCYERVSWNPTLASFVLSSWWHGFYPGYYMGLLSFGVSLMAAKKVGCRGLSSMGFWTTDANLYYGV